MKKDTRDRREYFKNRYLKNKERITEKKKECYLKNREDILKKCKDTYKNNRDKQLENVKKYYEKNKESINLKKRNKYNKERARIENKKWREENPEKVRSNSAKYKASKRNAVPKWLTKEHHKEIELFYKKRLELTIETGIEHHVDHIIPIRGKNVSGLHVPWNLQILTKIENIRKNNKYDET